MWDEQRVAILVDSLPNHRARDKNRTALHDTAAIGGMELPMIVIEADVIVRFTALVRNIRQQATCVAIKHRLACCICQSPNNVFERIGM